MRYLVGMRCEVRYLVGVLAALPPCRLAALLASCGACVNQVSSTGNCEREGVWQKRDTRCKRVEVQETRGARWTARDLRTRTPAQVLVLACRYRLLPLQEAAKPSGTATSFHAGPRNDKSSPSPTLSHPCPPPASSPPVCCCLCFCEERRGRTFSRRTKTAMTNCS